MISKNSLSILSTVVLLGVSGAVCADTYTTSNYVKTSASDVASQNFVSDPELLKNIRSKIGSGIFSSGYDQVSVQVNNGNVSLSGSVKTHSDKEKVEKAVRNIDGVKSLNSSIAVQQSDSKNPKREFPQDQAGTSADDQLNKKIRDNVSTGWLWNSYKEVTLDTKNAIVTLEGTVGSVSDQQKLMDEIKKIDGVQAVRSNLLIKN